MRGKTTYHRSVYVPKGSFLTVKYFSFDFVSFLINSEEIKKKKNNKNNLDSILNYKERAAIVR